MAQYRIYLSDQDNFVQRAVSGEFETDGAAVEHARTLVKDGGQVDVWGDEMGASPLVGSFRVSEGRLNAALVRRSRHC